MVSTLQKKLRFIELLIVVLIVVMPLLVVMVSYNGNTSVNTPSNKYVAMIKTDTHALNGYSIVYLDDGSGKSRRYTLYVIYSLYCKWSLRQLQVILDHLDAILNKYNVALVDYTFGVEEVAITHGIYRCIVTKANNTGVPVNVLREWIDQFLESSGQVRPDVFWSEVGTSDYSIYPSSECISYNANISDAITNSLKLSGVEATPIIVVYDNAREEAIAVRVGYMDWEELRRFLFESNAPG
jgi:hypothetical protein